MIPSGTDERRADLKSSVLERLHDPLQLRICVMAAVLLVGYFGVYVPLSGQITETTHKLDRDRKMLELAGSVERLQKQFHQFANRVPPQTDSKEWVQYVLEGVRQLPVTLITLDCRPPKEVGPYKAIVLRIELEGSFFGLDQFLRWLESNRRLLRTDEVHLLPARTNKGAMVMQITVLGMMG